MVLELVLKVMGPRFWLMLPPTERVVAVPGYMEPLVRVRETPVEGLRLVMGGLVGGGIFEGFVRSVKLGGREAIVGEPWTLLVKLQEKVYQLVRMTLLLKMGRFKMTLTMSQAQRMTAKPIREALMPDLARPMS